MPNRQREPCWGWDRIWGEFNPTGIKSVPSLSAGVRGKTLGGARRRGWRTAPMADGGFFAQRGLERAGPRGHRIKMQKCILKSHRPTAKSAPVQS
jgi:hypothetical protein